MADILGLTSEDMTFLSELKAWYRRTVKNTPKTYVPPELGQTPDIHVALAPANGIPARDGTTLGSATCDIYRVADGELELIPNGEKTVYNPSTSEVAEGEYVSVVREKWGAWLVASGATSGGSSIAGCDNLAALSTTDCLSAEGPSNTVMLTYSAGTWASVDDLIYPGPGSPGALAFAVIDGRLRLTLDGLDLLYCGDGCFVGGPLTGHLVNSEVACGAETFTVCLTCTECVTTGTGGDGDGTGTGTNPDIIPSNCIPDGVLIPANLWLTISSVTCPCMNGTWMLTYGEPIPAIFAWFVTVENLCDGKDVRFRLSCFGSETPSGWALIYDCNDDNGAATGFADSGSVPPLLLEGTLTVGGLDNIYQCCLSGNTIEWSITETPP